MMSQMFDQLGVIVHWNGIDLIKFNDSTDVPDPPYRRLKSSSLGTSPSYCSTPILSSDGSRLAFSSSLGICVISCREVDIENITSECVSYIMKPQHRPQYKDESDYLCHFHENVIKCIRIENMTGKISTYKYVLKSSNDVDGVVDVYATLQNTNTLGQQVVIDDKLSLLKFPKQCLIKSEFDINQRYILHHGKLSTVFALASGEKDFTLETVLYSKNSHTRQISTVDLKMDYNDPNNVLVLQNGCLLVQDDGYDSGWRYCNPNNKWIDLGLQDHEIWLLPIPDKRIRRIKSLIKKYTFLASDLCENILIFLILR